MEGKVVAKGDVGSEISRGTRNRGCELLIHFRALVLRFRRSEVEDHARGHIAVLKAVENLVD